MPAKREQFVVSIQSVVKSLDELTQRLDQTRRLCREILGELEDESKLGTFSEFDFGKEQLEEEGKKIHKELHAKLEAIEKQLRQLSKPMKVEQQRTASQMNDKVDKK